MIENTRLAIVVGQEEGQIVEVDQVITIGRQSSNRIQLRDASTSRRHCEIRPTSDGVEVWDLESLCGTFVNGVAIHRQVLKHGDYIKAGSSLFLYLSEEEGAGEMVPAGLGYDFTALSTLEMAVADSLLLSPEQAVSEPAATNRRARDLKALLRLGVRIQGIRSPEALIQALIEEVCGLVPAERVIVVLVEGDEFSTVFTSVEEGPRRERQAPVREGFSRSLAKRVLKEGVAVLSNDVVMDPTLAHVESLQDQSIRSVLCVPLRLDGHNLGILQADTSEHGACFDRDHLELLCGLAGFASPALHNALSFTKIEAENHRLRHAQIAHEMVGDSPAMRKVFELIGRTAPSDLTILIMGQSGTGKELVAQAIHRNSSRADGPFIAVNCASLSATLLESDLFGHERGAFTGAVARKLGHFELAHSGTLFLDEVGEIPLELQARMLRALEERKIQRVGSQGQIPVDVRIVAATNRDLEKAAKQGSFRQDLYFRLNAFSLTLPPLNERGKDVALLAKQFTASSAQRFGRTPLQLSAAAHRAIAAYDWPGNVRELKNAIERAVVLSHDTFIHPEDLPDAVVESIADDPQSSGYHQAVAAAKRAILLKALQAAQGDYQKAAQELGLNRTYLHRLISRFDLRGAK